MKRFQTLICASLILSTVGCASQREHLALRPLQITETAAAPSAEQPHPRLDKAMEAAKTTLGIMTLPVTLPYYIITTGCWPGPGC